MKTTMSKHNKMKEEEIGEIKKRERKIIRASKTLLQRIKMETLDLYMEEDKEGCLRAFNERVRALIREHKEKELRFIIALIVSQGVKTGKDICQLFQLEKGEIRERDVRKMLSYPWSGLTINQRHKKNTDDLQLKVEEAVSLSVVQGEDIREAIENTERQVSRNTLAVLTLMITELSMVNYFSTIKVLKGSEAYFQLMYNATFDNTCKSCADLHGELFLIGEEIVLPMHPNCKCFYTPVRRED